MIEDYPIISLFSGAMGLDLGLEQAGLNVRLSQDKDTWCVRTMLNNGRAVLEGDIVELLKDDPNCKDILKIAKMKSGEAFAVVGGPPCQSFSTMGKRLGFDDPRGQLVWSFFKVIEALEPRFFIMENVSGLYHSHMRTLVCDRAVDLGYRVKEGLLDAVDYGVPQFRERFILIGSRDDEMIFLPQPTHFQHHQNPAYRWRTLRDAISHLNGQSHHAYVSFSEERARFLRQVPAGGNWRSLSKAQARIAMGGAFNSGGGKTGFFRRLSWDEPSPTLVTSPVQKSTMLCHPSADRPLSVQEYARIQQFPDDWEFSGSPSQCYKQIGNAVPIGLSRALGQVLVSVSEKSDMVRTKRKTDATPFVLKRRIQEQAGLQAEALFRSKVRKWHKQQKEKEAKNV